METIGGLLGVVIVFGIIILFFLVCRAIVLWYWKVDRIVELLTAIDYKLGKLNQSNSSDSVPTTPPSNKTKVNPKSAMKNFEPLKDE